MRRTSNGAVHIEQALKRLEPGGRRVAIVGEGMAADKAVFKAWWKKIAAEYNVRANIGIDGAGYAKYSTTFDNQLLVIDKTGPTPSAATAQPRGQPAPTVTGNVQTPAEALPLLEGIRNEQRGPSQQPAGQPTHRNTCKPGVVVSAKEVEKTKGELTDAVFEEYRPQLLHI